jgi:NAD(P)-dependent dehydrogenase (short-subunit alcohol dehydrogenase family)
MSRSIEHHKRVAVITGGCGGIGAGIARRLQSEGAIVHVLDVSVAVRIDTESGTAVPIHFHKIDIGNEVEVDRAFGDIQSLSGRVDYLVCCAANFRPQPFLELTPENWQKTLQVNLTGSFLSCRAALRSMGPQKFGRIVLFSSMIARTGTANGAHYASSKGGVLGLARALALEVAADNIRVNTISPGITDTPQPRAFLSDADMAVRRARIPLGRIGAVEDMVEACMFLLSEDNSFLVGQDIRVNGGASLW